eukprot:SAG22_NODE_1834_length_3469_cov_1.557864_5_plen_30_part_01
MPIGTGMLGALIYGYYWRLGMGDGTAHEPV